MSAMTERAALVTGGSSGMGKAMARVLGQEGYALTICGRDEARLQGAVAELRAEGFQAQGVPADVADEAAVIRLVAAHRGAHGRLDVLVNSAGGGGGGGPVAVMPTEAFDRVVATNLRSVFLTVHHCLAMLLAAGAEHGKALVVNVGSAAGKEGTPGLSHYSAAKGGVRLITEAAQAENRNRGVQFTTFIPGFTATPMATWVGGMGIQTEEMVAPEDLGEGLRFLLRTSPRCIVREIEFMPPDQPSILARLAEQRRRTAAGV
jgi:NAD(P)-dependent dehydrogenase (short-subunit alcohol dehydrogenase family)